MAVMDDAKVREIMERHPTYESEAAEQDALWADLVKEVFAGGGVPFEDHWALFQKVFANRPADAEPPHVYQPGRDTFLRANLGLLMLGLGLDTYAQMHQWSVMNRPEFWQNAFKRLGVKFAVEPQTFLDPSSDPRDPVWLPGARLNAADTCFNAPADKVAILTGREGTDQLENVTYGELEELANRVSNGLREHGFQPGDAIALYMPMTAECVAAYLGIVRAGCAVVSIADSFAPPEVATRLRVGNAKGIITVEEFMRAGKPVDLYGKVRQANAPKAIVIPAGPLEPELRDGDLSWGAFLSPSAEFASEPGAPQDVTNILFSSGTTGEPKAIPWTHLTPVKAATDARYHQDVHPEDVVAWPTNIGWMMGPWLIYASFYNQATMALYEGAPTGEGFARFVKDAGVTVLGVVPSIVRAWRKSDVLQPGAWPHVRIFSSTGEASNTEDYLWLMSLADYRAPVIEYCGGTEIGGGHLTGTIIQPACPATFAGPALAIDFVILNDEGKPVEEGEMGELFLVPPSIGLSQRLLNRDHHEVYYEGCPQGPKGETLRRHGDEVQRLPGGYFAAQGRADDTMNLGGIKVSSLELERVMDRHAAVYQSAAVAVQPPGGGADELVAFAVLDDTGADLDGLRKELQTMVKDELNPLFRIKEVVPVDALPRTASNKIMRRELRKEYRG